MPPTIPHMVAACSLRASNPLRGVVELLDVVWRFTLAVAGRDPVPLLDEEPNNSTAEDEMPMKPPYNLRPRVRVNYKE